MALAQKACSHASLVADVAPHGHQAGYKRLDWKRRAAATTPSGRVPKNASELEDETQSLAFAFPAPLVLPEDDLAHDPSYPPQSFRSWNSLKVRNKVTDNRKTLYIARPPRISEELVHMGDWRTPTISKKRIVQPEVQAPQFGPVLEYLHTFYHGLEVKEYVPTLTFEAWESSNKNVPSSSFVGLKEGPTDSCTRIRTRPSPDGLFSHQLNLNDLLDGAINILPDDAYALLLLVDHDLYEDEDDEFCCGRAYGASRVAVVSSARYNPLLHEHEGIDLQHMWPASHCAAYVASQCGLPRKKIPSNRQGEVSDSPLHKAVAAFQAVLSTSATRSDILRGLWLFCLARTACHELGHCFGMDHCVYYACVMQGTASVAEDLRQPPYLCPICATKLSRAVEEGTSEGFERKQYAREAVEVMMELCAKWKHVGAWAGYEAWLKTFSSWGKST